MRGLLAFYFNHRRTFTWKTLQRQAV